MTNCGVSAYRKWEIVNTCSVGWISATVNSNVWSPASRSSNVISSQTSCKVNPGMTGITLVSGGAESMAIERVMFPEGLV